MANKNVEKNGDDKQVMYAAFWNVVGDYPDQLLGVFSTEHKARKVVPSESYGGGYVLPIVIDEELDI